MTETTQRQLDEAAPAPFVNGDARHLRAPDRASRRTSGTARRAPTRHRAEPPTTEGLPAWPGPLLAVLAVQETWRGVVAALAREQLDFLAASAEGLVADGRSLTAEPDPARRTELGLTLAMAQLERSLASAGRSMALLGQTGGRLLDAVAGRPPA